MSLRRIYTLAIWVVLGWLLVGAAPAGANQPVDPQLRANNAPLNVVLTKDFEATCDKMARALILQPFIQSSPEPPIISIRPIENKTGLSMDLEIFQETIRVKLVKHSQGRVLFRDDKSRRDIIMERAQQQSEVTVKTIDEMIQEKFAAKPSQAQPSGGFGGAGAAPTERQGGLSASQIKGQTRTSGRLAEVDYFLRGLIFSAVEPDRNNPRVGFRYWQYQFRVVDARTGVVVWEDLYRTKAWGQYQ